MYLDVNECKYRIFSQLRFRLLIDFQQVRSSFMLIGHPEKCPWIFGIFFYPFSRNTIPSLFNKAEVDCEKQKNRSTLTESGFTLTFFTYPFRPQFHNVLIMKRTLHYDVLYNT